MKKNIRVWPVEIEKDWIWISDALLGGLYRYNKFTGEVICEIDPINLYYQDIFCIKGIVCWKEYIIICPAYIHSPIAIFSKKTKEFKIVYMSNIEKNEHLDGAREIKGYLYLNLFQSNVAILRIKLDELCNPETKMIVPEIILYPDNMSHIACFTKHLNDIIYLPIYNEKIIYKMENEKLIYIFAEIPQNICTMCLYETEMWILSLKGWEAYRINSEGKLLEKIEVEHKNFPTESNGAHNIIVTKDYVFFLFCKNSLGCYDKKQKCMINMNIPLKYLENQYPCMLTGTFLFGVEENNKLFLFPYGNMGLEIDLLTFQYKPIEICFPDEITTDKIMNYTELVLTYRERKKFIENRSKSLSAYLKYSVLISDSNIICNYLKNKMGEKIYKEIL